VVTPSADVASPREQDEVRLIDALPDLARHVAPEQLRTVRSATRLPVLQLAKGKLDVGDLAEHGLSPFGAVVVSGLLTRHVDLGGEPGMCLYGPGDVLAASDLMSGTVPHGDMWFASVPSRLAVLDDHLLVSIRRWPRLVPGLVEALCAQHDRALLRFVIAVQRRVEDRLLMLFWHLGDRFGRMTPDGIVIPISLTHEALARLVGARRPTITLALGELHDRDAVVRRADRAWLVKQLPEGEIALTLSAPPENHHPRPLVIADSAV
jgi:CRP-like cAMP-binding protein